MTAAAVDPGTLSQIALALMARLQIVFPATRFQFDFMPPRIAANDWDRIVRRPPFIGLGWSEWTGRATGRTCFSGETVWPVYLVVNNESGMRNRLLGDQRGPGLFQLVEAAVIALSGCILQDADGNRLGSCTVTRAAQAFAEGWTKESIAMAAIDVSVTAAINVGTGLSGGDATPDLLGDIAAAWVFADPADPGAQLAEFNDISLIGSAQ